MRKQRVQHAAVLVGIVHDAVVPGAVEGCGEQDVVSRKQGVLSDDGREVILPAVLGMAVLEDLVVDRLQL